MTNDTLTIPNMYEETIRTQCDRIFNTFDPAKKSDRHVVQDALRLYRHTSFSIVSVNETTGNLIIKGGDTALLLSLHGDVPFSPTDDAKALGFFMYAYAQFDSVETYVQQWKSTSGDTFDLSLDERTPTRWLEVFRHVTEPLRSFSVDDAPHMFLQEADQIRQRCIPLTPFEWEWRPIFQLYFTLTRLEASFHYVEHQLSTLTEAQSYDYWQLNNWVDREQGLLYQAVQTLKGQPRLFETDPFFEALPELLHTFAIEQTALFSVRFQTYEAIWTTIFTSNEKRDKEWHYLQETDALDAPFFTLFFAQLTERANSIDPNEWIQKLPFEAFERVVTFSEYAENHEYAHWLNACMAFIDQHYLRYIEASDLPHHQLEAFIEKIDHLFERAHYDPKRREFYLQSFGTLSQEVYAKFLIERKRWNDWIYMMQRNEVPYQQLDRKQLHTIEKEAPSALLPLFHTYVETEMKERTRPHYKQAVRFLEQMKTYATSSALHDWWNHYIDTLKRRYSRLRAFQEELQKGSVYAV